MSAWADKVQESHADQLIGVAFQAWFLRFMTASRFSARAPHSVICPSSS
jgi:hypothetical protein